MNVDYSLVGIRIRSRRREMKMTQEELAEALSVSVGYVSQVERGVTKISLDLLANISGILDCDIAHFISGTATSENRYLKSELVDKYEQLTASQKRMVLGLIDVIIRESDA